LLVEVYPIGFLGFEDVLELVHGSGHVPTVEHPVAGIRVDAIVGAVGLVE